jgi:RHH-type proline utilization regulon transcriptional repressor/proline dehydrogenase/delta 1-pyrroline-5-carboxylate dehydrogenase
VLRYISVPRVVVRHAGSDPVALARFQIAAEVTGVGVVVSHHDSQGDAEFISGLRRDDRVRLIGQVGAVRDELAARAIWHDATPPSANGRVELVKWVREQAVSRTLHRHGRITGDGDFAVDDRRDNCPPR